MSKAINIIVLGFLLNNIALCQNINFNALPNYKNGSIMLIGENHSNFEKDTIEFDIIKWYAQQSKKPITVILERPHSMELFIDKLFQNDDSLSLKQYLIYSYDRVENTFVMKEKNLYNKILALYSLNKTTKNIKIKCVDRELYLRAMMLSIKQVLTKYRSDNFKIAVLLTNINTYITKEILTIQDYEMVRSFFRLCQVSIYNEYKTSILYEDLQYINTLAENFKPMISDSETRENLLYHNIVNNWDTNSFFIAIHGIAHVNKYYSKNETISGNRKSIGFMLNSYTTSPFRNRVSSVYIVNFNLLTSKGLCNDQHRIYFMTNEEKKQLYSLSKQNIKCVVPDSKQFKYAHKAYDLLILVDTAHFYDYCK